MRRSCAALLVIPLTLLIGGALIYQYVRNQYNPVYHGKRLYDWADQALEDKDPEARRQATEVLREALRREQGDRLWQFLLRFVKTPDDPTRSVLPKEIHPFLIEALGVMPDSYPAMTLEWRAGPDTVPALSAALRSETDPAIRRQAAVILGRLGSRAQASIPALQEARHDPDPKVRHCAAEALEKISPQAPDRQKP